jgi:hypothetical protein
MWNWRGGRGKGRIWREASEVEEANGTTVATGLRESTTTHGALVTAEYTTLTHSILKLRVGFSSQLRDLRPIALVEASCLDYYKVGISGGILNRREVS